MKRIVLAIPWEGPVIGIASLFLVGIIQQETILSHLIVWGFATALLWQAWARRRQEKARTTPDRQL
jgi:hypothetical protein